MSVTHLDQAQSSARGISVCPVGSFTYRIHLNASPQCYGMAVHETVRIASGNTDRIASGNTGKLLKSNSLVRSCMRSSLRYWPMAALVWPEDTQRQVLAPWGLSDSAFSSTSGLVKRQYKAIRMLRRGKFSLSERIALYCLVLPCIASHKRVPLASLLTPRCVHTLNLTKYHIWEHPRL